MTTFLLPCECSADIAVTAGQAGGNVACSHCGRERPVPKLGDLMRLPRRDDGGGSPPAPWRPAHAVALLGAIIAAASLAAGVMISPGSVGAVDEAALRQAVLSADDHAIYTVWTEGLSRAGVWRPPADEEQVLLRRARFSNSARSMLLVVAAVAAVATGVAAGVLLCDSGSTSGRMPGVPDREARR